VNVTLTSCGFKGKVYFVAKNDRLLEKKGSCDGTGMWQGLGGGGG
jgi:hypothetical protein